MYKNLVRTINIKDTQILVNEENILISKEKVEDEERKPRTNKSKQINKQKNIQ
jgi:hypothetical protein